jgi:choline monooxygenase
MHLKSHCLNRPLSNAFALHADFYTQAQYLAQEQEFIFSSTWQLAAHADDIRHAGDHVITEIAGKPILIVRDEALQLRAFYNVCQHRAGPIATCNGKAAKSLQCAYHGWTYHLNGKLKAATEMQSACDFDPNTIALKMVRVQEWQGLIFVALNESAPHFSEIMSGITERILPIDLSAMHFAKRDTYSLACNWKVYIDNFLEGYHLPFVHPGLSKVLDYRVYDTELFNWHSLQHSPLRNNDDIYGDGHAFYYFIYPNIMLNITPGRLQTNRILPDGPHRCVVEFDYYYTDDDEVQKRVETEQAFSDEIQREDIGICEQVQKGLMSGAYEAGRINPKRESGLWHFHNLLRTVYGQSAPASLLIAQI